MSRGCWWAVAIAVALLGLAGTALVVGLALFARQMVTPPAKLGVAHGQGAFVAEPLFTAPPATVVMGLRVGPLDPAPGTALGVALNDRAIFLDARGGKLHEVSYDTVTDRVMLIDSGVPNSCDLLVDGAWGQPARLLGHTGKLLWASPGLSGVDSAAAGDVDGDGRPEIAVGYNGGGGVHLYDLAGHELWRVDAGNAWHVEIADTDGSGKAKVLHSDAGGRLTVLDGTGRRLFRGSASPGDSYFDEFAVSHWPTRNDPLRLLHVEHGRLLVMDTAGRQVKSMAAPGAGKFVSPAACLVRFAAGQSDYTAVAACDSGQTTLYLYDPQGTLAYQEVIQAQVAVVAALPEGDAESLLVAGRDRVLRYRRAAAPPAGPAKP